LPQHGLNLVEKVVDQGFGVFERIWPAGVVLGPMPVIPRVRLLLEPRDSGRASMSVVEANQSLAIRRMQSE
jgi:hypothetical protein